MESEWILTASISGRLVSSIHDAPFVCLEPWLSMGVTEEEHTEEYLEKPGIQHLEGGRQASFSFTLNVF